MLQKDCKKIYTAKIFEKLLKNVTHSAFFSSAAKKHFGDYLFNDLKLLGGQTDVPAFNRPKNQGSVPPLIYGFVPQVSKKLAKAQ